MRRAGPAHGRRPAISNVVDKPVVRAPNCSPALSGDKSAIAQFFLAPSAAKPLIESGRLTAEGDTSVIDRYASVLDTFDPRFNVVTP